ncbi:hypothetical protein OXX69_008129 [Metschnikowia pulcherrima]
MSRNKEKAQAGLNRYYEQKMHDAGVVTADPSSRPRRVQSVQSIAEAELWRKTVLSEFSAKMSAINDPSLGDDEIRELNETLTKLHNEKRAWEYHIQSLGGNDYIRYEQKLGTRVGGKLYFGRAKQLPEARMAEKIKLGPEKPHDSGPSLDYYGVYEPQWKGTIDASREKVLEEVNNALGTQTFSGADLGKSAKENHTQRDVERWLVERKKRELMAKLLS